MEYCIFLYMLQLTTVRADEMLQLVETCIELEDVMLRKTSQGQIKYLMISLTCSIQRIKTNQAILNDDTLLP